MEEKKKCNCPENEFGLTKKTICDLGVMLVISLVVVMALHRIITKHIQ